MTKLILNIFTIAVVAIGVGILLYDIFHTPKKYSDHNK